jgi:hypothetical protein
MTAHRIERVARLVGDGQAAAVDRDRLAEHELRGADRLRRDLEHDGVALAHRARDPPDVLDETREHGGSIASRR